MEATAVLPARRRSRGPAQNASPGRRMTAKIANQKVVRCRILATPCYSIRPERVEFAVVGGPIRPPDQDRCDWTDALDQAAPTTDQKVGGSNPSERAEALQARYLFWVITYP